MKSYAILFIVFYFSQSLGETVNPTDLQQDILKRLSSPNDTLFQAEAKNVIAQYLVSTVLEDSNEILAFRRDKDKGKPHHKPHKPHTDYRDYGVATASPIISNPIVNSQPVAPVVASNPIISNPAVVQSIPQNSDSQSRLDVTQVPVTTGTPAVPGSVVTNAPVTAAPVAAAQPIQTAAPVVTLSTASPVTRPTVDPAHVYNQVDKILGSVATGNIVGIVDESLAIRAPTPVRNFVTGILKVIFCNPIDRLLGRCRPNSSGQISSVQGG